MTVCDAFPLLPAFTGVVSNISILRVSLLLKSWIMVAVDNFNWPSLSANIDCSTHGEQNVYWPRNSDNKNIGEIHCVRKCYLTRREWWKGWNNSLHRVLTWRKEWHNTMLWTKDLCKVVWIFYLTVPTPPGYFPWSVCSDLLARSLSLWSSFCIDKMARHINYKSEEEERSQLIVSHHQPGKQHHNLRHNLHMTSVGFLNGLSTWLYI